VASAVDRPVTTSTTVAPVRAKTCGAAGACPSAEAGITQAIANKAPKRALTLMMLASSPWAILRPDADESQFPPVRNALGFVTSLQHAQRLRQIVPQRTSQNRPSLCLP
jgi:hypothetical protein